MRRVCVVVTARPSYSRVKTVIRAIHQHADLELQLVVAASALLDRYGRVERQILSDGFPVSARVFMVLEGENPTSMAKTTGIGILELATVFDNLTPDVVVSVADRYETLATATASSYMGIPLAHIQGGEVTGSIDERVRHAVTKLADLHFPATQLAAERIKRMGEDPSTVHVTGCPSIDIAASVEAANALSFDPYVMYSGVGPEPDLSNGFNVVMQHPVTTEHDDAERQVAQLLQAVMRVGVPVLWFWPNIDAGSDGSARGIRKFRERNPTAPLHFFKNMSPEHFIELLQHAQCIVGNSSVAIRECAFLGVPAVNIGTRQMDRERAQNVVDVGHDREEILKAIEKQRLVARYPRSNLYGDGTAGVRIANLLATERFTLSKRLAY